MSGWIRGKRFIPRPLTRYAQPTHPASAQPSPHPTPPLFRVSKHHNRNTQVSSGVDGSIGAQKCGRCDHFGHSSLNCQEFVEERGQLFWKTGYDPDATQPSASELHCKRACNMNIEVEANIHKIDGSGLACFYLMIIAGLAPLKSLRQGVEKPVNVNGLVQTLSTFLETVGAAKLEQTLSGLTLLELANDAKMDMQKLASSPLLVGSFSGLGGTDFGIAVAEIWEVSIYYWQPICSGPSKGKFQLVDVQRPTVESRGDVHAEWIPVWYCSMPFCSMPFCALPCCAMPSHPIPSHPISSHPTPHHSHLHPSPTPTPQNPHTCLTPTRHVLSFTQGETAACSHFNLLSLLEDVPQAALTIGHCTDPVVVS